MTHPRARALACLVALLLTGTGCASRVSHERIVADWNAGVLTSDRAASNGSPGSTDPVVGASAPASAPRTSKAQVPTSGAAPTTGAASAAPRNGARSTTAAVCKGSGTIKLGNVAPYSATAVGSSYKPIGDALQVWQADVNAQGGICGRQVQVIQRDDKGSTSENASQVKDLVENQHVVALVGEGTALTLEGSRTYLEDHHVAVIGGDVLSMQWSKSPALFPQGLGFDELIFETVRSTQPYTKGNNKMALLYCAEAQACTDGKTMAADKGLAKKAGVDLVYTKQTSLTQISFASECQAAHDAGAASMFLGGDASFIERVANSCGQQGLTFEYTAAVGASSGQADNQYLNGHFHVATQVFPWTANSSPAQQHYQQAWKRYYPQLDNSGAAASGYVSGLVVQHILELLGSTTPTSQNVWDTAHTKVKDYTAGGLTGPLTYRPGGQASPRCGGFVDLVGGAWVARSNGSLACRSGAALV
jgi:branched-chain amino acid transport system substrate-binding protein